MEKRKSNRFKVLSLFLGLVTAISLVTTACSKNEPKAEPSAPSASASASSSSEASASPSSETLEPVELTYYFAAPPQKDLQAVNDALNKITKEKINATVKLNLVDFGAFDQKMNLMISSGEAFDLTFTSTWLNSYFTNAAKGAYLPIDELLDKYAPNTKANVPANIWEAARVNGKLYGVVNYQIMAAAYGVDVQKSLAEKYNFDYANAKTLADLEPFLEAVKKGEPTKVPLEYATVADPFTGAAPMYGYDVIADQKMPGWIKLSDASLQVVNQYDTPEFKSLVETMHSWYEKGYVDKNAATIKDTSADRKVAKYATIVPAGLGYDSTEDPTAMSGLKNITGVDWVSKRFIDPLITTDRAAATITAISKTSKNPERAMMFLELMNSDPEVITLLNFGIEGKHHTKTSENRITRIKDSGYDPNVPWEFGNNLFIPLTENDPDNFITQWDGLNKKSAVSPIIGFTFNSEPVKSEIAQSQVVIDQYLAALTSGTADPAKVLPEFNNKLKSAGIDKIIAEKQKQLNEWRAANGK